MLFRLHVSARVVPQHLSPAHGTSIDVVESMLLTRFFLRASALSILKGLLSDFRVFSQFRAPLSDILCWRFFLIDLYII